MSEQVVFYAVGDVGPMRDDHRSIFHQVEETLQQADLAFCQLEPVLSTRGEPLPQAKVPAGTDPSLAKVVRDVGFNIVSFATNHCMDYGQLAFQDTIDALREQRLHLIGAGEHIEVARKPAIVNCKGNRIAFLAYNSILPHGFWAEKDRPGCVPLRAHTLYEQIEHDQPGTPCRIHTFPHEEDLKAMIVDIQLAKQLADIVIVSMHWGIHFSRAELADYQRELARAAIDAGADLILGHHAHILKGIEVYKGKAIFYSLGNFAIELPPEFKRNMATSKAFTDIQSLNPNWDSRRAFWPPDSYKTILVQCTIADQAIQRISFFPAYINFDDEPEMLAPEDERFHEVVQYVADISREAGLEQPQFFVHGTEVTLRL